MSNKNTIQQLTIHYSLGSKIGLIIGSILFSLLGLVIVYFSFQSAYPQLIGALFGVFFLLFGGIFGNSSTRKISISKEAISDTTFFKKTILKKENIAGFALVDVPNSKEKISQLVIFSKGKKRIKIQPIEKEGELLLKLSAINQEQSNITPKILLIFVGLCFFLYYQYVSKGYD